MLNPGQQIAAALQTAPHYSGRRSRSVSVCGPHSDLSGSFRSRGNDLLRPGQLGERRVGLGLIPIGHAVIVVPALEGRTAIALLDEEANGLVEHDWIRDVPAVGGGIGLFEQGDAKVRETSCPQSVRFAEIIFRPGALHRVAPVNIDDFIAFTPPTAIVVFDAQTTTEQMATPYGFENRVGAHRGSYALT